MVLPFFNKEKHRKKDVQWRCVYDKGVRLKFPRKNIGTCWKCHQWSIEPILLVHTGCLCNRMVMVRPCKTMQMKNLLAIKGNSPDSGESLVVDPKYNSYRPTWVKHVWLCLFEMFIIQYSCCECLLNGIVPCDMCHCKHAVSCYCRGHEFVFDCVSEWETRRLYGFCVLFLMTEQRKGGTSNLAGWMRRGDIWCGCLFTQ